MRWLACAVALAACGDDTSGSGSDAGVPSSGGAVFIFSHDEVSASGPEIGGGANAVFIASSTTPSCVTTIDSCRVLNCPNPGQLTYASAGIVTISGLVEPVTLTPQGDKTYGIYSVQHALYAGGETITISAPGAETPPFTLSFTAASRAMITAPAKPTGSALVVDRAQDFTASWTGGGVGQVEISVSGPMGISATCSFDANAGTGTIPSAVLSMLPAGTGSFLANSVAKKAVDVGDWRFNGETVFNAVWATDTSHASTALTLQ